MVGVADHEPAGPDDAPVRALAAVVGQATEQRRGVDVGAEGLEGDRLVAQFDVAALDLRLVDHDRGFVLARAGHGVLLDGNWADIPEA